MRAEQPVRKEFVYFIRCGDHGPVKIGKATDLRMRLGTLQVGNPHQLNFVLAIEIEPGESNAQDLETMLHRRLRSFRIRGEWFDGETSCQIAEVVAAVVVQRDCGRIIRSLAA